MSARRPSSSSSRRRGAMWTTPRAIRSKHASTASTAAAGDRSLWTSLSEKNCVRALILLDGADLAARLEDGQRTVARPARSAHAGSELRGDRRGRGCAAASDTPGGVALRSVRAERLVPYSATLVRLQSARSSGDRAQPCGG